MKFQKTLILLIEIDNLAGGTIKRFNEVSGKHHSEDG